MRNNIPCLLVLTAFLLVPGSPAAAAEEVVPLSTFIDQVEVNIVNIEVFVTDRDGRRVPGLTREDFEIYEDGQPVEVTNFYAVAREPAEVEEPAAVAAPEAEALPVAQEPEIPEEQQLFLVVYVDNFNLLPRDRAHVLKALPGFLEPRVAEGAQVMLLTHNRSIEVVQPFTDDFGLIAEGIEKIRRSATLLQEIALQQRLLLRGIALAQEQDDDMAEVSHLESYIQQRRSHLELSTKALRSTVRTLGILPGRKAILYLSNGLELQPGKEFEPLYREPRAEGKHRFRPEERHLFNQITREANAHQVTFYTLDARGHVNPAVSPEVAGMFVAENRVDLAAVRDFNLQASLIEMAVPTGGTAILNATNFEETLARMGEDFENYYSLGYASSTTGRDRYHKIEVKLRRRGLRARHRTGYLDKPAAKRMADRTLSSLVLDRGHNPLGIELAFGEPEKKSRNKYLLPVLVRIPSGVVTFVSHDEKMEGRLRLYVAIRDEAGGLSPVREQAYPLSVPREVLETAPDGDIGYQTMLEIREGNQGVSVGVRDEISGAESIVHETVVVGKPPRSKKGG
ncbi:MAG: VWA domain-containing protein [bacterium]|nr:VWA domain-containing protein [bacterium]